MEETNLRQLRTWIILNFEVRWGREPRILFLSGDVDIPWSSVMRRGVLNTDFTDYTDVFIGGRQDWRLWSHCEEAQNYPCYPCYPCSIKNISGHTKQDYP